MKTNRRGKPFSAESSDADVTLTDGRTVLGYHGTSLWLAETILASGEFVSSKNDYDWLGHGVYFWEHAPLRAWQWARRKYREDAAVLEARIELRTCLDLSDIRYTSALQTAYNNLRDSSLQSGTPLPINRNKARCLDCLVINYLCTFILPEIDTVRAPFLEGSPVFEGSMILEQSHIQLVVRNLSCIVGPVRQLKPEA